MNIIEEEVEKLRAVRRRLQQRFHGDTVREGDYLRQQALAEKSGQNPLSSQIPVARLREEPPVR